MLLDLPARTGSGPFAALASSGLAAGTGLNARMAGLAGAVLFSLYILLVAVTAIVLPDRNWDTIPYLAVAAEDALTMPEALHDYAYATVRAAVSPGDYRTLADDGGGYRTHMAEDAAAFHSMLPMYRVKFLYAEILSGLGHVMEPLAAMRAVQVAAVLLFGGIVLLWLDAAGALALAPVVGAVMITADFAGAARGNTPDLLCAALLLGGLFAHLRRREAAAALLIVLAVAIRPDNVVFAAIFAVLLLAFRQPRAGALAAAAASVAAYLAISRWAGHPGWWPQLYFSSVEQQMTMDGFDPDFSLLVYLRAFANAFLHAVTFNTWIGVAALALAGWFATHRAGFRLDREAGVVFAAFVLAVAAKFAVFPIHDTRIYLPYLVPPFLILATPLLQLFKAAAAGKGGNAAAIAGETP